MKKLSYAALTSSILATSMTNYATESLATEAKATSAVATAEAAEGRVNQFKPIVLPFYDPSIKAGVMAVRLYAFYPDDNGKVSTLLPSQSQ